MDVLAWKQLLDAAVRSPSGDLIGPEAAWAVLRGRLNTPPSGMAYQELCFSVDEDERQPAEAQPRLLLYLGWLMDAEQGSPWRTVEISLYYHYRLTPDLADRVDDLRQGSYDTALDADPDDPDLVGTFLKRVDSADSVWATLRGHSVERADYTCVVASA